MSKSDNPFDKYILGSPHYESSKETYALAANEFLKPYPSTPLEDFPIFSRKTGGFRPREFSIICGSTGIGKTTLCANISKSLIQQKVSHFVASVETGRTDFLKRVISAMAKRDWNTGESVPLSDLKEFHEHHYHNFEQSHLYLSRYEDRFSVETLMSEIAWMVKNNQCKIAIIDNLNFFLDVTRASDQIVEMDRVIHDLIIFCKQVDVHLIMIMHPKKTDGGRVESEFDIKGSSTAVQEAHNVFLFNRAGEDMIEEGHAESNDRELKIAKMRRRGLAVGTRIVLRSTNGVYYEEGPIVIPH